MPKRRKLNNKVLRKRILLLCEGEKTEPLYFNDLKSDIFLRNKLSGLRIQIHKTDYSSGMELVDEAIKLKEQSTLEKNEYDKIWVVIDKDGYRKHPSTFEKARINNIQIAFSSISFEYWFLLHFKYTTTSFIKCDSLIKELLKHIPDYKKSNSVYGDLRDRTPNAIKHAERVREYYQTDLDNGTPIYSLPCYTNVDELVSYLLSQ